MAINITVAGAGDNPSLGLSVAWEGGQFVMIVAKKGLVSCGIVDRTVMEKFGAAIAISRGTPEKPLVTVNDLLSSRILEVTEKAAELGITVGMTGKEALDLLS